MWLAWSHSGFTSRSLSLLLFPTQPPSFFGRRSELLHSWVARCNNNSALQANPPRRKTPPTPSSLSQCLLLFHLLALKCSFHHLFWSRMQLSYWLDNAGFLLDKNNTHKNKIRCFNWLKVEHWLRRKMGIQTKKIIHPLEVFSVFTEDR